MDLFWSVLVCRFLFSLFSAEETPEDGNKYGDNFIWHLAERFVCHLPKLKLHMTVTFSSYFFFISGLGLEKNMFLFCWGKQTCFFVFFRWGIKQIIQKTCFFPTLLHLASPSARNPFTQQCFSSAPLWVALSSASRLRRYPCDITETVT